MTNSVAVVVAIVAIVVIAVLHWCCCCCWCCGCLPINRKWIDDKVDGVGLLHAPFMNCCFWGHDLKTSLRRKPGQHTR